MENSKRVKRIIKYLEEIELALMFYTNDRKVYNEKFSELYKIIEELSLDKKEDHVRLAKKLKAHWNFNKED